LVGPTGVGKSSLACALAQSLNAEILGADAFQVYAGIPILTAQPGEASRLGIPHHLIGCVPCNQAFDVAAYLERAKQVISDIQSRGKVPLVVGGTGLYVRALTDGLSATPPTNSGLRLELEALTLDQLVLRLNAADPLAASMIDCKNPRRVIRAIEICELSGQPLSSFRNDSPRPARGILLLRNRDDLHARIERNVQTMFPLGVLNEVSAIRNQIGPTASRAIGFREIASILDGKLSVEDGIQAITVATRQYAKRQLTWFRNQTTFPPLEVSADPSSSSTVEMALRHLQIA
jgi:tRNA dimethylallyltransferase